MSTRLRLKTVLHTYGHTRALKDGTVAPRTFDFDFEEVPVINRAFRRMVRQLEFAISEMAVTTYICARVFGKPLTAIPVFIKRSPHHGLIQVNRNAGVRTPKDLEGRRVGVNRGYTVTGGVWARYILQHEYGVELNRITWVLSGDEHVAEWQRPPNVTGLGESETLEELLVTGHIPAAIGIQVDSPAVGPLIPNPEEAAARALKEEGFYPINHTVVIRNDVLAAHPGLSQELFDSFVQAKRLYLQEMKEKAGQEPAPSSPDDRFLLQAASVLGDPLPYGLEPNRKMLETLIQACVDQRILARPVSVDDLFPGSFAE